MVVNTLNEGIVKIDRRKSQKGDKNQKIHIFQKKLKKAIANGRKWWYNTHSKKSGVEQASSLLLFFAREKVARYFVAASKAARHRSLCPRLAFCVAPRLACFFAGKGERQEKWRDTSLLPRKRLDIDHYALALLSALRLVSLAFSRARERGKKSGAILRCCLESGST